MFYRQISNFKERFLQRFRVVDLTDSAKHLREWYESDLGAYINAYENRFMCEYFSQLPGYRLLRLGLTEDPESTNNFGQLHRFSLHPTEVHRSHAAICNYDELPIPSGVIDVTLLQHSLEFSASPKAVLSEACRVTAPGGHLLLFVFNPFGVHGIKKFPMQLLTTKIQYRFHNLRSGRVVDWLSLLGFEVVATQYGAHRFFGKPSVAVMATSKYERWCEKLNLPFGNIYIIHAVKREVQGVTRKKHIWRQTRPDYSRPSGEGVRLENICKR
jgi:SAM-dependent methyltransferase